MSVSISSGHPISDYLAIPYKWDGRDFDGVDCYGLIVLWFKDQLGIDLFDMQGVCSGYQQAAARAILQDNTEAEWVRIPLEEIKRHDCLLIKTSPDAHIANHCGIVQSKYTFLHILEKAGCNISRIDTYRKHIFAAYRHKGLIQHESSNL